MLIFIIPEPCALSCSVPAASFFAKVLKVLIIHRFEMLKIKTLVLLHFI